MDKLAKLVLIAVMIEGSLIDSEFLFECILILVSGDKVTESLKKAINRHWRHLPARELYHSNGIINRIHFDLVWWDGMEMVMKSFPKMFRVFITKQVSKFCGTNCQLKHIDDKINHVCPSCGNDGKSSRHITRCNDPGRRVMLEHSVKELRMAQTKIDPHLQAIITIYLLGQSSKSMLGCL